MHLHDDRRPVALALVWAGALLSFALAAMSGATPGLALAAAAPCTIVALGCPLWARRSAAAFDRDLVRLLAAGAPSAATSRIARAYGLRFFGRRQVWYERVGRAAAVAGDARLARGAFARALGTYADEDAAPLGVRLGYANACYALADDVEACWAFERLLARDPSSPGAAVNLAHALFRRDADPDRVERAIARAFAGIPSAEERATLELVSALLSVRRGRRRPRALARHGAITSERLEALRRELWRAHGARREITREAGVIALHPRA